MIGITQSLFNLVSSNTTGAAGTPAQIAMSTNHIFNPLIFSATENAAFNAAHTFYMLAELGTHYALLPALPLMATLAYKGTRYMLGLNHQPQPQVQVQPAPRQGWLSWAFGKTMRAASKVGGYVVLPEGASYIIHQLWAKAKWDGYRFYGTSFLRPFFEKTLPTIYEYWDKGDLNFSLRDLVPSWQNWNPAYGVREFFNFFRSRDVKDAEVFARAAYQYGQAASDYLIQDFKFAVRAIKGLHQSPECFRTGEAFQQCVADTGHFIGEVTDSSPILSTIKTTVSAGFNAWSQFLINNGLGIFVTIGHLNDQAISGIANLVQANTFIPAPFTYTALYAVEGYLAYKFAKVASRFAVDKLYAAYVAGPSAILNNFNIFHARAANNPLPQQPPMPVPQQPAANNGNGAVI